MIILVIQKANSDRPVQNVYKFYNMNTLMLAISD